MLAEDISIDSEFKRVGLAIELAEGIAANVGVLRANTT